MQINWNQMLSLKIGSANLKKFLRPISLKWILLENQLYEVDNVEREFDKRIIHVY